MDTKLWKQNKTVTEIVSKYVDKSVSTGTLEWTDMTKNLMTEKNQNNTND